jgi:hypothetical protein
MAPHKIVGDKIYYTKICNVDLKHFSAWQLFNKIQGKLI